MEVACSSEASLNLCVDIQNVTWPKAAVKTRKLMSACRLLHCTRMYVDFISLRTQYLLTYILTPWNRALLEKLTGFQLVKKFPAFYETRRFITAFTSARHLSLSSASSIQSMPPHSTSWRSILILSSHLHLGLPSGLFPPGFPTKTLYTPLLSPYVLHVLPTSFFSSL